MRLPGIVFRSGWWPRLGYLKSVNDTYGHEAGDTVIKIFREILKAKFEAETLRPHRRGGILSVITHASNTNARVAAERIRAAWQETRFVFDGSNLAVMAIFGLAGAQGSGLPSQSWCNAANTSCPSGARAQYACRWASLWRTCRTGRRRSLFRETPRPELSGDRRVRSGFNCRQSLPTLVCLLLAIPSKRRIFDGSGDFDPNMRDGQAFWLHLKR